MKKSHVAGSVLCAAVFSGMAAGVSFAGAVNPVQTFDLGKLFLRNNNAVYSAIISPAGSLSAHSAFVFLNPPRNGVYTITGLPASVPVSLSFNPAPVPITCACGGAGFSLVNVTFSPTSLSTGPGGDVTVNVGATLRTSGDTTAYLDGAYSGLITFNIDY